MAAQLSLPAELTIYTVGELHPQWLSWMATLGAADTPTDIVVDGAAVDQIDAAGVQLLTALLHSLVAAGRAPGVAHASPLLRSACDTLGLPLPCCIDEVAGDVR